MPWGFRPVPPLSGAGGVPGPSRPSPNWRVWVGRPRERPSELTLPRPVRPRGVPLLRPPDDWTSAYRRHFPPRRSVKDRKRIRPAQSGSRGVPGPGCEGTRDFPTLHFGLLASSAGVPSWGHDTTLYPGQDSVNPDLVGGGPPSLFPLDKGRVLRTGLSRTLQ